MSKLAAERTQRAVADLALLPGNDVCADCKARNPRWASYNLGIFICVNCASIHRKIGSHITKVKSLTLDAWTKEQVEHMKRNGNIKSNLFYCPNETKNPPPTNMIDSERDSELEKYIRAKYEHKRFVDKSAFVAAQLGPSRSASSITSVQRPQSTPLRQPTAPAPPTISKSPSLPPATANAIRPTRSVSQPLEQTSYTQVPGPSPLQQPYTTPLNQIQQSSVSQPNQFQQSPTQAPLSQLNQFQQPPQAVPTHGAWSDLLSLQQPGAQASASLQYQPVQVPLLTTGAIQPQMTSLNASNFQAQYPPGGVGTSFTPNPFFQSQVPMQPATQPTLNQTQTGVVMQSQLGRQYFGQQVPTQISPSPQPFLQPHAALGYSPQPEFLSPSQVQYTADAMRTSSPFMQPSPSLMQTSPSPFAMQPQQQPQMFAQPQQPNADQFTSWLSRGPGGGLA